MMWQDIVITIANILFSWALIPQVYHGFKNKRGIILLQTATLTTIGLYSTAFAFFTLKLYFSATISTLNGTFWLLLLIQRLVYNR
jgi:hypothetical protein